MNHSPPGGELSSDDLLSIEAVGLKPEECIYIDDIKEYSDAASTIGIRGIHYTDHESLLTSLTGLGCIIH